MGAQDVVHHRVRLHSRVTLRADGAVAAAARGELAVHIALGGEVPLMRVSVCVDDEIGGEC